MASESVVRSRAGSILAEAAVMLVVGFYFFAGGLGGSELVDYAAFATVWTFRGGGIALLAVGLLCLSGWRESLLANALLDLAIGLVFAVSGAILMVDHNASGLLIGLFGLMSLGSARWDWNAWRSVQRAMAGPAAEPGAEGSWEAGAPPAADDRVDADRAAGQVEALKRIVEQKRGTPPARPRAEPPAAEASSTGTQGVKPPSDSAPHSPAKRVVPQPDEPPPEGFLADLGRDDEERK